MDSEKTAVNLAWINMPDGLYHGQKKEAWTRGTLGLTAMTAPLVANLGNWGRIHHFKRREEANWRGPSKLDVAFAGPVLWLSSSIQTTLADFATSSRETFP